MRADCGHDYQGPKDGTGAAGYATVIATGKTLCYPCADTKEREDMAQSNEWFAYMSNDRTLTTWTGGHLATMYRWASHRRRGFGGWPFTVHTFNARSEDGREWYGTSPGPGMYARMRARKGSKVAQGS